jgi:hypothetical protein
VEGNEKRGRFPGSKGGGFMRKWHYRWVLWIAVFGVIFVCLTQAGPLGSFSSAGAGLHPFAQVASRDEAVALSGSGAGSSMLQFKAGSHLMGFQPKKVYFASLDHALSVEFLGTPGVIPTTAGNGQETGNKSKTPSLRKVVYEDLWEGISLTYEAKEGGIAESAYHIALGADVSRIRLRYNVPVEVQRDGSLKFKFESGFLTESSPVAWQEIGGKHVPVEVAFRVSGGEVGFSVGKYDPSYPLTIDPTYAWHTFYGSSSSDHFDYDDWGAGIAVDATGNVYVSGSSYETWNGPAGQNPLHAYSGSGSYDIFVLKISEPPSTPSRCDFNGDGKTDILWRNKSTGQNVVWLMNGTTYSSYSDLLQVPDTNWQIVGTGDFNGDGKTDILWRNKTTGENVVWLMNGTTYSNYTDLLQVPDTNWQIVVTGDFNGDGKTDILWRNKSTGQNVVWLMNGTTYSNYTELLQVPDTNWEIVGPKGPAPCPVPGTPSTPSPSNGATGVSTSPTLSWAATSNTGSYDVYFGTSSTPPYMGNTTSPSYPRSGLSSNSTYYWKIVAKNNCGSSTSGPVWSFSTTVTSATLSITKCEAIIWDFGSSYEEWAAALNCSYVTNIPPCTDSFNNQNPTTVTLFSPTGEKLVEVSTCHGYGNNTERFIFRMAPEWKTPVTGIYKFVANYKGNKIYENSIAFSGYNLSMYPVLVGSPTYDNIGKDYHYNDGITFKITNSGDLPVFTDDIRTYIEDIWHMCSPKHIGVAPQTSIEIKIGWSELKVGINTLIVKYISMTLDANGNILAEDKLAEHKIDFYVPSLEIVKIYQSP